LKEDGAVANASTGLFAVRITALRDSESQERVALYLSGRLRGKTVEELRGYLDRLPIVVTRRAAPDLAERIQRELSNLGAVVELEPIGAETAPPSIEVPPPPAAGAWIPVDIFAAAPIQQGFPWDLRGPLGIFRAWWETLKFSLRWPDDFFARMSISGGYQSPLLYAVICNLLVLLISLIWVIPILFFFPALVFFITAKLNVTGFTILLMALGLLLAVVTLPLLLALMTFIGAAIMHLFVVLLGGRGGYQATFRVACFANSGQVLQVVPYLGPLAAIAFWFALVFFGYRHAHRLEPAPAIVAMVLPLVMVIGAVMAAVIAVIIGVVGSLDLTKLIPE